MHDLQVRAIIIVASKHIITLSQIPNIVPLCTYSLCPYQTENISTLPKGGCPYASLSYDLSMIQASQKQYRPQGIYLYTLPKCVQPRVPLMASKIPCMLPKSNIAPKAYISTHSQSVFNLECPLWPLKFHACFPKAISPPRHISL
ncbi:unnamed protein product, partial [Owenia fusiformis]